MKTERISIIEREDGIEVVDEKGVVKMSIPKIKALSLSL